MWNFIKKYLIWIVVIIVVFFSINKSINLSSESNLIESNPILTIGKITSFDEVGIANYYLDYSYKSENIEYKNRVASKKLFNDCQHNNNCINKEIYIRYYKNKPSISKVVWDSLPKN